MTGIARLTKVTGEGGVEGFTALCALQGEVVLPPSITLRPQLGGIEHTAQTLKGGHIGHASLGVEFLGLVVKVEGSGLHAVGAMATDTIVGRTGDVTQLGMELLNLLAQGLVD